MITKSITSHDLLDIKDYIIDHLPTDHIILHISEVGSFMWGMGNEDDPIKGLSDHDIFVVYQVPTKMILSGYKIKDNLPNKHDITINGKQFDFSFMEIGHLINLIIKGNINAIWGLTSSIIYESSIDNIMDYVIKNINNLDIFPSTIGMSTAQLIDSTRRARVRSLEKSINCAYRTLMWAKNINDYGTINYELECNNPTKEECYNLIEQIKNCECEKNKIHELYLRECLYKIRRSIEW